MIFLFWVMRETIASAFLPLITESREAASVRSSRAGEKASIIPAAIRNAAPVSSADSSKAPMRSVADISLNFRANASISSHISYPRVELIESHINMMWLLCEKSLRSSAADAARASAIPSDRARSTSRRRVSRASLASSLASSLKNEGLWRLFSPCVFPITAFTATETDLFLYKVYHNFLSKTMICRKTVVYSKQLAIKS